jgi:negative regulator of flagellin synthesis FlgM
MKIHSDKPLENQGVNSSAKNVQKPASTVPAAKADQAMNTGPTDKVDISGRSKEIADLMSAISKIPDVRDQKVQDIKQAVESGAYAVDPRKIAEKLLKEL